jgi:hypothetical protein
MEFPWTVLEYTIGNVMPLPKCVLCESKVCLGFLVFFNCCHFGELPLILWDEFRFASILDIKNNTTQERMDMDVIINVFFFCNSPFSFESIFLIYLFYTCFNFDGTSHFQMFFKCKNFVCRHVLMMPFKVLQVEQLGNK